MKADLRGAGRCHNRGSHERPDPGFVRYFSQTLLKMSKYSIFLSTPKQCSRTHIGQVPTATIHAFRITFQFSIICRKLTKFLEWSNYCVSRSECFSNSVSD